LSIRDVIESEDFHHVFQPIFSTKNTKKIGYEALIRSNFAPNPETVFKLARKEKQLFELDSRSIQKAVRTFYSEGSRLDGYLFVNICPSTIIHSNFPSILQEIMSVRNNSSQLVNESIKIVFEISESENITDSTLQVFKERISKIKDYGILVAIDDIGKGFDALTLLIEIEPNFLKLDRYFSKDLFKSRQKQTMISLLKKYCDQNNCAVILEGIENDLDLTVAQSIGILFVQGFLLGKPVLLHNIFED
jgi:EAL domain-containing protein (putative c-di-GMP-specific phosphodiesterase class I)